VHATNRCSARKRSANFKVTSSSPIQADFLSNEGTPDGWHLRLAREGTRMNRWQSSCDPGDPIRP
jgi:hypothetical protein